VRQERRTGGDPFDLVCPLRRRAARNERDRQAWSIDVDRHQPGLDVHAIPGDDTGQQERGAAAVRRGDIDSVEAEHRLRPRAAVRADA
jgi:hypothetical protein